MHGDAQVQVPEAPVERRRAAAQRKANRDTAMALGALTAGGLLGWAVSRRKQR